MQEIRKQFSDFVGSRAPMLFEWIENALEKVVTLQFHELSADQAVFLGGSIFVVALAILRLAKKPSFQK